MEGFVRQSLLYDFYGDLLTQHQKEIYEAYVLQNLSLGEIAEESGISRQGVHDLIRRCNVLLDGYENKLKLVERFLTVRETVGQIQKCADLESAQRIAGEILDII